MGGSWVDFQSLAGKATSHLVGLINTCALHSPTVQSVEDTYQLCRGYDPPSTLFSPRPSA